MSTVPLYETRSNADAWHAVTAPGGYEWWYFDAEDPATDTQIVAIFLEGFVFHPGYLRSYNRYLKRPTRLLPPTAKDFVCAYLVVYQHGKVAYQFMTQHPAGAFEASRDRAEVTIGQNRLTQAGDGSLWLSMSGCPWKLTWQGPKLLRGQTLAAELAFTPTLPHPPAERMFFTRNLAGAEHHWVIANPRCEVSGSITVSGGAAPVEIHFRGRGYHDHNYGTAPIGPGLSRWIWGRLFTDDGTVSFHFASPKDASIPDEVHLLQAASTGISEIGVNHVQASWSKWSWWGLAYPKWMTFDDRLTLRNPRLIDSSPFYLRLMYDASYLGHAAKAFCEVAYPHRLRLPILGRMIEMSIQSCE